MVVHSINNLDEFILYFIERKTNIMLSTYISYNFKVECSKKSNNYLSMNYVFLTAK